MRIIFIYLLMLLPAMVIAQTRTISGKVTSAEDNMPLPGVNVVVEGTTKGTVTDTDGNYSFQAAPGENTLVFSFVGFLTQTVAIGERQTIDVIMQPDAKLLEEIVVVGYGIQK